MTSETETGNQNGNVKAKKTETEKLTLIGNEYRDETEIDV